MSRAHVSIGIETCYDRHYLEWSKDQSTSRLIMSFWEVWIFSSCYQSLGAGFLSIEHGNVLGACIVGIETSHDLHHLELS
jgi:hypothetical protein